LTRRFAGRVSSESLETHGVIQLALSLKFGFSLCGFLLVLVMPVVSNAQNAEALSQVRKIYVDSLGQGEGAEETRSQLVRRLEKSHQVQVLQRPAGADAIVKGTTQIWQTGHISLSPRSHAISETAFVGFLSVEVVGKNNQTLWSYLVTPGNFPLRSVPDDLAGQLVTRLLEELKGKNQRSLPAQGTVTDTRAALRGAGATFPAPLYKKWFSSFGERHPDVNIYYDAVGSAEGIRRLTDRAVDFSASDMPLSDEALSEAHQHFVQIPTALGAVVPIYHVDGLSGEIRFTPEVLAGIYLGKIKKWSDPQIRFANRGAALPDADIVLVHRSDGSGTTYVWTDYLSKVSSDWKASAGAGLTVQWPVGVAATYNEGFASKVQQTPNSIGYVEFIYAIQHELSFAAVRNAAGRFVKADIAGVTAAAQSSSDSERDLRISITNSRAKDAYPIASYTWMLLPQEIEDQNKRAALVELVRWMLTSGQKTCAALGYAPLPTPVAKRGLESFDTLK
jgi:phosphate transport system substrate-binding protein